MTQEAPSSAIVRRPSFSLRAVDQVLLVRWGGPTNVEDIEEMRKVSRELGLAHPRGIAHLNLVDTHEAEVRELDDESREAILRMLRDAEVPLRVSSVVFVKDGFQAALVRAILGGLLLLSRTRAQVRVHSSLYQGAEWIAAGLRSLKCGEPPTVEAMLDAMASIKAESGQPAA